MRIWAVVVYHDKKYISTIEVRKPAYLIIYTNVKKFGSVELFFSWKELMLLFSKDALN